MIALQYERIPDLEQYPTISVAAGVNRENKDISKWGPKLRYILICLLFAVCFFISFSTLQYVRLNKSPFKKCKTKDSGAPYLYVTVHSGDGVLKFGLDGCFLTDDVLKGGYLNKNSVRLRSMHIGKFNGSEALIIADSRKRDSRVALFGACSADSSGKREYLMDVIDELGFPFNRRRGATHPYGITQDISGNIYASFQDTDSVLRFMYSADAVKPDVNLTFKVPGAFVPVPFPPDLPPLADPKKDSYYNGTFMQLGLPEAMGGRHDMGIRSIIFVRDNLWVANEMLDGIFILDKNGRYIEFVSVKKPIGLVYVEDRDIVYVSTKKAKVYAIDTRLYISVYDLKNPFGWDHPTGMAVYGSSLFVADQNQGKVYLYNVDTTQYTATIIDGLDRVEQLAISSC
jgi:hypothetical protein